MAFPTTDARTGDLGVSAPISNPRCDGEFITLVGASVTEGQHQAGIKRLLDRHRGSSYLLTEASCSSLRARLSDGGRIYVVYYGPFATQAEACQARVEVGSDSYVKRLDNVSPIDQIVKC
jgi:serine/threonine-protein kinase